MSARFGKTSRFRAAGPSPAGVPAFRVLDVRVDALRLENVPALIERALADGVRGYISPLGVAGIMEAQRNPVLRDILNASWLNTPDGMPLVWLGRAYGFPEIGRVYGPDFMREVCRYSADKGWRHFLYGGGPGLAQRLQSRLERQFPGICIVGTHTPPFRDLTPAEADDLAETVRRCRPDIFWIGISTPRQLYFMAEQLPRLNARLLCAVGYAFDINAGTKRDAPPWIQQSGFQWLHRMLTDPRLARRYLRDNPAFTCYLLKEWCGLGRSTGPDRTVSREDNTDT